MHLCLQAPRQGALCKPATRPGITKCVRCPTETQERPQHAASSCRPECRASGKRPKVGCCRTPDEHACSAQSNIRTHAQLKAWNATLCRLAALPLRLPRLLRREEKARRSCGDCSCAEPGWVACVKTGLHVAGAACGTQSVCAEELSVGSPCLCRVQVRVPCCFALVTSWYGW